MTRDDTRKLLDFLSLQYSNFEITLEMIDWWAYELQEYDLEDVKDKIKKLMSEERYAYVPPLLEVIKKGLVKKHDKVDFTKLTYLCSFCRKAYNDRKEYEKHTDRCRSVKYIISQYRRFNLGEIDNAKKKELYNMNEEEFIERYNILLKYVQKNTNDELEKRRIEFIFNPPNLEQARKFLNS